MTTLEELKENLANQVDEVTLLELLGINSFDLVERFDDKILERFARLEAEFGNQDTDN